MRIPSGRGVPTFEDEEVMPKKKKKSTKKAKDDFREHQKGGEKGDKDKDCVIF